MLRFEIPNLTCPSIRPRTRRRSRAQLEQFRAAKHRAESFVDDSASKPRRYPGAAASQPGSRHHRPARDATRTKVACLADLDAFGAMPPPRDPANAAVTAALPGRDDDGAPETAIVDVGELAVHARTLRRERDDANARCASLEKETAALRALLESVGVELPAVSTATAKGAKGAKGGGKEGGAVRREVERVERREERAAAAATATTTDDRLDAWLVASTAAAVAEGRLTDDDDDASSSSSSDGDGDGDGDASAAEDGSGDERDDDGWPRYSPPGGGARATRASEGRAEEEEEEGKENVDPRAFDRSFDDAVEELEARITKKLVALLDH